MHVGLRQGCPLLLILFVIFIDRTSRGGRGEDGVWFGNHSAASLLFAGDLVLLASSSHDVQRALEQLKCETSGMNVRSSKSGAMVLN